ncbi:MAG: hypothetical protein PHS82_09975 [Lachnospiraceae bacterium]|nr:hypothetical protein [Lachnospiraceae bacterium]
MTDNELLLSITGIIDKRVTKLEEKIDRLDDRVRRVETKLNDVETRLYGVESEMSSLKQKVTNLELTNENIIIPRLQNIESCYTSTSKRYMKETDRIDQMQDDVDLLKIVVQEHSIKLQTIV